MINIKKKILHIDDTPLVSLTEAEKANSNTSTSSTAKARSSPSNEYVLNSYGEPVGMTNDGGTSYFGTDILGTIRNVTDKYGRFSSNTIMISFFDAFVHKLKNAVAVRKESGGEMLARIASKFS